MNYYSFHDSVVKVPFLQIESRRTAVALSGAPKIIQIEAERFEETPGSLDTMRPSDRVTKDDNGKESAWSPGKR